MGCKIRGLVRVWGEGGARVEGIDNGLFGWSKFLRSDNGYNIRKWPLALTSDKRQLQGDLRRIAPSIESQLRNQ